MSSAANRLAHTIFAGSVKKEEKGQWDDRKRKVPAQHRKCMLRWPKARAIDSRPPCSHDVKLKAVDGIRMQA